MGTHFQQIFDMICYGYTFQSVTLRFVSYLVRNRLHVKLGCMHGFLVIAAS